MSDATLKHARMSDELERALIQEAIQAQALSDGPSDASLAAAEAAHGGLRRRLGRDAA